MEIGPLINLFVIFFFKISSAISKHFLNDSEFIKFREECSKTGTTEESIALGEKIGFRTNLFAINPLDEKQKVKKTWRELLPELAKEVL